MAKTRIVIDLDYHPATKARSRLLELLEWARDGYGINAMEVTEIQGEES